MKKILIYILTCTSFCVHSQNTSFKTNCHEKVNQILLNLDDIDKTENLSKGNRLATLLPCYLDNRKLNPKLWEQQIKELVSIRLQIINKMISMQHYNLDTLSKYDYWHRVLPPDCFYLTKYKMRSADSSLIRSNSNIFPKADLSDFTDQSCKQEYLKRIELHKEMRRRLDYEMMIRSLYFNEITMLISDFYFIENTDYSEFYKFMEPLKIQYVEPINRPKFEEISNLIYLEKIKWIKN